MTQSPRKERDFDMVIAEDLRPAGDGKHCFYCHQPLGDKHLVDCVIREGASWYHVALRDNDSGEIRLYRHDMQWGEHDHFSWTENNYSCDCNRHLFFLRASGPGPADDPYWMGTDRECGHTKYSALYAELQDGTRIELDEAAVQVTDE